MRSHIVDLRFFCGFTFSEIAAIKEISERTAQRHWEKARIYLHRARIFWTERIMETLTSDQWHEVSPYLDQALSLPEGELVAWLDALDAENSRVATLLKQLLHEHRKLSKEGFLESPLLRMSNSPSLAGQRIGPYTVLSLIGEGGMGSVWLAERNDGCFERQVAIKILNRAVVGSDRAERFKRSRRL